MEGTDHLIWTGEQILAFSKRVTRILCYNYNYVDQEDITQEIAIRILKAQKSNTVYHEAYGWILAKNTIVDWLRKGTTWYEGHRRYNPNDLNFLRRVYSLDNLVDNDREQTFLEELPAAEDDLTKIDLLDTLKGLTKSQREALYYIVILGFTVSETAKLLNETYESIYQRVKRAKFQIEREDHSSTAADFDISSEWLHARTNSRDFELVNRNNKDTS